LEEFYFYLKFLVIEEQLEVLLLKVGFESEALIKVVEVEGLKIVPDSLGGHSDVMVGNVVELEDLELRDLSDNLKHGIALTS
jgi:hypothetical protein